MPAVFSAFLDSGMKNSGTKLLGPSDAALDDEIARMPAGIEGFITAGTYSLANPLRANQVYVKAFKDEYGADAIPNVVTVAGWDAMSAIYGAVRKYGAKITREQLLDFMAHWQGEESPRGDVKIDP